MDENAGSSTSGRSHRHGYFKQGGVLIVALVLFSDFVLLNYKVFTDKVPSANPSYVAQQKEERTEATSSTSSSALKQEDTCGDNCKKEIYKIISSLSPSPKKASPSAPARTVAKEYYIPFGTGNAWSTDWIDVPGVQAYIDGDAYGSIKNAVFEATMHVPTGNETAEIQLFNVTAGHPVWGSSIVFDGGTTSKFLTSKPITIESGSNLYKIQMKTQLSYPAYLDQARVHITTY